MDNHEELELRDPEEIPTYEMLEEILGDSYDVYETFQEALPDLEIEQEWQWNKSHKVWSAKGQHWWTSPRGTEKEKNLYWLLVYKGYFSIAVWFLDKNREKLLKADVSEKTKDIIATEKNAGKMATFRVLFNVKSIEALDDIYTLIDWKKKMECK